MNKFSHFDISRIPNHEYSVNIFLNDIKDYLIEEITSRFSFMKFRDFEIFLSGRAASLIAYKEQNDLDFFSQGHSKLDEYINDYDVYLSIQDGNIDIQHWFKNVYGVEDTLEIYPDFRFGQKKPIQLIVRNPAINWLKKEDFQNHILSPADNHHIYTTFENYKDQSCPLSQIYNYDINLTQSFIHFSTKNKIISTCMFPQFRLFLETNEVAFTDRQKAFFNYYFKMIEFDISQNIKDPRTKLNQKLAVHLNIVCIRFFKYINTYSFNPRSFSIQKDTLDIINAFYNISTDVKQIYRIEAKDEKQQAVDLKDSLAQAVSFRKDNTFKSVPQEIVSFFKMFHLISNR